MDYLCTQFGHFSFSRFGINVRADRQNHTQTRMDAILTRLPSTWVIKSKQHYTSIADAASGDVAVYACVNDLNLSVLFTEFNFSSVLNRRGWELNAKKIRSRSNLTVWSASPLTPAIFLKIQTMTLAEHYYTASVSIQECGVVVRASDLQPIGRRFASRNDPGQVVHTHVPLLTKQYKLVPAKGRWCSEAGKVWRRTGHTSQTRSYTHLPAQWPGKGRWAARLRSTGVWHLYLYLYRMSHFVLHSISPSVRPSVSLFVKFQERKGIADMWRNK